MAKDTEGKEKVSPWGKGTATNGEEAQKPPAQIVGYSDWESLRGRDIEGEDCFFCSSEHTKDKPFDVLGAGLPSDLLLEFGFMVETTAEEEPPETVWFPIVVCVRCAGLQCPEEEDSDNLCRLYLDSVLELDPKMVRVVIGGIGC